MSYWERTEPSTLGSITWRDRVDDDWMRGLLEAGEAGGWTLRQLDSDTIEATDRAGVIVQTYVRRAV